MTKTFINLFHFDNNIVEATLYTKSGSINGRGSNVHEAVTNLLSQLSRQSGDDTLLWG